MNLHATDNTPPSETVTPPAVQVTYTVIEERGPYSRLVDIPGEGRHVLMRQPGTQWLGYVLRGAP